MSDKVREKPALRVSKDYSLFVHSKDNRPVDLDKRPGLVASMKEHGFIPSYPISVFRLADNKLEIRDGQHRVAAAQKMGLPVWYVINDEKYEIASLNREQKCWTPRNYAECFAEQGQQDYAELITFVDEFKIPFTLAASLLGGYGQNSGNTGSRVLYSGEFKIKSRDRARRIAIVYRHLYTINKAVKNGRLLGALYACMYVDQFDIQRIIDGASRCPEKLVAYSTTHAYLEMLEELYNFGRKVRISIKVPAENAMRARNPSLRAKAE